MSEHDQVAHNLAVVNVHFQSEAIRRIEPALDFYTDDIVWEAPSRQLRLHGKDAAAENYRAMFASMANAKTQPVQRFGTPDRVVDESILSFRLTGDGIANAPVQAGTDVQMRLIHLFEMRDGRIARESAYEMWPAVSTDRQNARASAAEAVAVADATPERIMQLGLGFWGSKVLLSAVELGVFTELAQGPLQGEALAKRLGLHPRAYRDFFDALVALGMLERNGDIYANGRDAEFLLDRRKPSYVGGLLEMANTRLYGFWGLLTQALRTGQPQNETSQSKNENPFEALYSDPERLRSFLQSMTGISMGAARAIAQKFPWKRHATFLDIGGAQGALPVQLALAHEHLTGGNFDLPVVGPVFQEYVNSFGLATRLKFHPGNFFTDPLPKADVLIMGHILHDWNLAEKKMLLGKAYEALPAGGALIIHEALIDDERRQNAFGLLMSLNMLIETSGGFDYTGAECSAWMREAGFRETWVEHLVGPDSMVVGMK